MPMVPTPAPIPSVSQSAPVASWGLHYDDKKKTGLVYRWFCVVCRLRLKGDSYSHTAAFWDITEGQWWRETLPVGRTLSGAPVCSLYLVRYTFYADSWVTADGLRTWSGTWKKHKKIGDKEIWGKVCE